MTTKNSVHNYYIRCECGAQYSDTIEACLACGKKNPEMEETKLNSLNAKEGDGKPESVDPNAPTLNGKDPA